MPNNPMGKAPVREGGPSLVEDDMKEWAKQTNMSLEDVKANLYEELGCDCDQDHKAPAKKPEKSFLPEEKLQSIAKGWEMDVETTKHNICDLLCTTTHK